VACVAVVTYEEMQALKDAIARACREANTHVSDPPAAHRCLDEALRLSAIKRRLQMEGKKK
jgi:hypothetical protein